MADKAGSTTVQPRVSDAIAASQRLKLQSDYGHAVMWSRGFAAAETKSAFSRATELAAKSDDFSVRFTAFDGQCRSAITRGELRSAWELASSFLREAQKAERLAEARATRRHLGLIAYFRGDFFEAATQFETALDARSVERGEAPEGFGDDIRAVATTYLALTNWQLGEVDRARELIDAANRRAEEIGHVPSKATALYWGSYLEILRGDRSAALRAAEALVALAQAHAMTHFSHMAELNIAWARGGLNDPAASAEQFRQALKAHLDRGFKIGAGFYTGLLADLEAETLSAESALARIDQALDLLQQADNRFDLPLLHRIRGDILLKRDPADPAAPKMLTRRPSRLRSNRARAVIYCLRPSRSPGSVSRLAAPPTPTPSSLPRSKASRRRRRCTKSRKRRRRLQHWRRAKRSKPQRRNAVSG
jgi:tetratricopeptide (TPR) repeat protein